MGYEQVFNRVAFVLYGSNSNRLVNVDFSEIGEPIITIDLHMLKVKDAKKIINDVITVMQGSFTLALIHGYTHGTVLNEYIYYELENTRVVDMYCENNNLGETYLKIA